MNCKITLGITNLHACPGDNTIKKHKVQKQMFSEADLEEKESEINQELAESREKASTRTKSRVKVAPLIGFRDDFLYKCGGPYGKFAGMLKQGAKILWSQKTPGFTKGYKSFVKSLIVRPMYSKLDGFKKSDIAIASIPQITAGAGRALIIQYYETIPYCETVLEIMVPDASKKRFEKLLDVAMGLPFGPKSRGMAEIKDISWEK